MFGSRPERFYPETLISGLRATWIDRRWSARLPQGRRHFGRWSIKAASCCQKYRS